jgi:hypothetical protein
LALQRRQQGWSVVIHWDAGDGTLDEFNGCVRARSLSITAQIKIMGEHSSVFMVLWLLSTLVASKKVNAKNSLTQH